MLIKLTGERYIQSEYIESMEHATSSSSTNKRWVRMTSGDVVRLSEAQFKELLDALPTPYDAENKSKRDAAERTLRGQMGYARWHSLGDDEQIDAINAEVEAQEQMGAKDTHGNQ